MSQEKLPEERPDIISMDNVSSERMVSKEEERQVRVNTSTIDNMLEQIEDT